MTIQRLIGIQDSVRYVEDLKKSGKQDVQKFFDEAIQIIHKENEEIQQRNNALPWIIRFLNPVIKFLSCGSINLCLEELQSLNLVLEKIDSIKKAMAAVPEIEQTWRLDYDQIKERYEASKPSKEKAANSIQRCWRSHLRRKISRNKQTYESWRANAIVKNESDPINAAAKLLFAFKPTHYTFTHGQSIYNTVITATMNFLTERFKPEFIKPDLIHFRVPGTITDEPNVHKFLNNNKSFQDSEEQIAAQLLSVDGYIFSTEYTNSAHWYYVYNNCCFFSKMPKKPIEKLVQDDFIVDRFINRIHYIASSQKSWRGSLYSILIPKKIQDNPDTKIVYTSIAFGTPHIDQSIEFLESHQKYDCEKVVQFRILLNGLSKYPGIRVFRKNHLSEKENQIIMEKVKAETDVLYLYSILLNLKAPITQEKLKVVQTLLNQHNNILDKETLTYLKGKIGKFIAGTVLEAML